MNNTILNITNGDYFNKYFISKYKEKAVPFCEVMMDGNTVEDIYSKEFIELRAKSLNVTLEEYRSKMYVYDELKLNNYSTICLWFGKDTFCQMNMLTVLAYLEQIKYEGLLKINFIDDETFEVLEVFDNVKLGIYNEIYKEVLILKKIPNSIGLLFQNAIDLYFDYHSSNGKLANIVRNNFGKDKKDLITLLLFQSKDYGLSDIQIENLINLYYKR